MVMLQLVDQVVAVKNVGASLGLTGSPRGRGAGGGKMRRTHRERNRKEELVRRQAGLKARTWNQGNAAYCTFIVKYALINT